MKSMPCPACGTQQSVPDGAGGFHCGSCQRDVWRVACRKCKTPTMLFGSAAGAGALTYRCPRCKAQNTVQKPYLRAINADYRRRVAVNVSLRRHHNDLERQAKVLHKQSQQEQAVDLNSELHAFVDELKSILTRSLQGAPSFSFSSIRITPKVPPFEPGALATPKHLPAPEEFQPPPFKGLETLVPGARKRHAEQVAVWNSRLDAARQEYERSEALRLDGLSKARQTHDAIYQEALKGAIEHNAEVDALESSYKTGDEAAVVQFSDNVLENSDWPEGFPRQWRIAFSKQSKQLVVELELPEFEIIPEVLEYRYMPTKDEITTKPRPVTQRKALYQGVVAQLALRTIHELLSADVDRIVETIALNGHVRTVDRRTGGPIHPCLVTLRTTRDIFTSLNLSAVDPVECLKGLNASLSRSPSELVPVRPVLEFDMVDPRFVQEADVLSTLDTRPNLMDLSFKEFESLVTNLFTKMGLETRQTQPSRDGGVDCVAYDARPIFGGRVVIQAKRYKNTVGVSAVRDLFGTLQNEGASKGILVTTSGYGQASHEFANGKPLELLDGANLLYLLKEYAGIDAKIEPPEDWVDPVGDAYQPITEPALDPGHRS